MRADIHDGPEHMLQSEAGYIDARPLTPARQNLLQRTAGPYILVKAGQSGGHCWSFFLRNRLIQYLQGCVIEIAKAIGLESIGDDCKQQVPRQMSRGLSPEDSLP